MDSSASQWQGDYDSAPAITIIADTPAGIDRSRVTALGAGGRIARIVAVEEGEDAVRSAIRMDAVIVDLDADHGACADALLRSAARRSDEDGIPLLVTTRQGLIDPVFQAATGARVAVLVDADPAEAVTTLALALHPDDRLVADVATEMDAIRLQRLADEVSRIAKALSNLTGEPGFGLAAGSVSDAGFAFRPEPAAIADLPDASDIRAMIRLRRLRERFFQPDLFADPAWDMLLDLTAAHIERVEVAVSSLCIAAAVPPTTALRWIKAMTDQGLFERCADPDDGRRIFIRLSQPAAKAMFAYLNAAKRQSGLAV